MTYTLENAKYDATSFENHLKILHSIDTKNVEKKSKLVIDIDGYDSYTDSRSQEVHLGVVGIYDIHHKFLSDSSSFYSAMDWIRMHECCHIWYTSGAYWDDAIIKGEAAILKYIADKEEYPLVISRKTSVDTFKKHLEEKYSTSFVHFIMQIVHGIVNSMEDGRIERIYSAESPYFKTARMVFRNYFWDANDEKPEFPPYALLTVNPIEHLRVLSNQVLMLSTCQVYEKGLVKAYAGTPLIDEVQNLMPYIAKGYLAKTTGGLVEPTAKICGCLAPYIYEAAELIKDQPNDYQIQMLLDAIKDLLKSIAENEDFGDDLDAMEDESEADGMNSALGSSDLVITLDDETYDKLMEKSENNESESKDGGLQIRREHPKEDEKKSDSSRESDSNSTSQDSDSVENNNSQKSVASDESNNPSVDDDDQSASGDDSKSEATDQNRQTATQSDRQSSNTNETSESKNTSATTGRKGNTDSGDEADNGQSSPQQEDTASTSSNSKLNTSENGGQPAKQSGGENSIRDTALKKAEKELKALSKENLDEINAGNIVAGSNKARTPVCENNTSVDPEKFKGICENFVENPRNYKVNRKLPSELQAKGDSLHREIGRYFKSLKAPSVRYRRNGRLDKKSISRLAKNDVRVFMKNSKNKLTDGCVYVLIDNSGSMGVMKRNAACEAAAVIEEGFKGLMPMKIVGFEERYKIIHHLIKNWDEILPENGCWNYRCSGSAGAGNDDAVDIAIATKELLSRPEQKKILIVLSDGAPANREAVRNAVTFARNKGIQVSSIYFEVGELNQYDIDTFDYMYQYDYICCAPSKIEENLVKILRKFAHSK